MFRAFQFRPGSLIGSNMGFSPDRILSIDGIKQTYISEGAPKLERPIRDVRPCIITMAVLSEWFGFRNDGSTWKVTSSAKTWEILTDQERSRYVFHRLNLAMFPAVAWDHFEKHIKWAHELQNLWYDLTNEPIFIDQKSKPRF